MTQHLTLLLLFVSTLAYGQKDTIYINSLLKQADANLYKEPSRALQFSHEAFSLSQQLFYVKGGGDALHKIGIVYDITSEYDSALYYFSILHDLGKKTNDSIMMATGLNSRGLVLWNMGKPKEALPVLYSAYILFDKKNDVFGKAKTMNNISLVYMELDRDREALKAAKIAVDDFKKADHLERIGAPLTNIGLYYIDLKQYDSAKTFLHQALDIKLKLNDYYGLGISYNSLGTLYDKLWESEKAQDYYIEAIKYKKKVGDRYGYISSSYNLADNYRRTGNNEKGFQILSEVLPDAEALGNNRILYRIYYSLFRYHGNKGAYKKALDYHVAFTEKKDSVLSADLRKEMEDMRTHYETDAKEKENLLLKEKNRVQKLEYQEAQQREQIKTISLIFSGILFVLFIITAILFYKRYKQKQEQRLTEEVQQAEEKERGRIARDLHDNVGAHLAFIIQRLDQSSATEKEQLSSAASNALGTLRETVWALNKNNISTEDFSDKLKIFVRTIQSGFPNIHVYLEEEVDENHRLSPATALNLFRLCQEAVSNAFRHSQGNHIHIEIKSRDGSLITVRISDDGIGFDPIAGAKKDHYGLDNMKHRAKEAGAEYELHSEKGKGTTITITKRD